VTTDALAIVCPSSDVSELSDCYSDVEIVAQEGEGLAAGLVSAFRVFLGRGFRHVIALASDSPQIPRQTLMQAFELLENSDVVIGPTIDGGYYLVGATVFRPELFSHDRIGTSGALDSLMAASRAFNLEVALIARSYDVDQPDDLARLSGELDRFPSRAPRTAKWLSRRNSRG
jgi:glycosyltransferase A (GT-A) superfamily protein (DUF2064 family)